MHAGSECFPSTRQKYVNHPYVQAYYKKIKKTEKTVNRSQDPATWLGMGDDLDTHIGIVLDKIKELGIEENTYVIMVSDNGYRHKFYPELTQPLHSRKWWGWQGIRVPMVVKGPGIPAASVFDANVINYDFLPTFVEWAGGKPSELKDIDGVSLAGYINGKKGIDKAFRNRELYFHYPHYRKSMPHSAIISGNKKVMHFYERPDIPMLFDIHSDKGEVRNIAKQHPEEHKAMHQKMMTYLKNVGARFPKMNPDYDSEVYKKLKQYEYIKMWGPFEGKRPLEADER